MAFDKCILLKHYHTQDTDQLHLLSFAVIAPQHHHSAVPDLSVTILSPFLEFCVIGII
jgi:hypothetical protein